MLIILDRDGVINYDSPDYIKSPDEWHAIPGSLEAIVTLNRAGHQVVVASNQSGVSRGYFSLSQLLSIHYKMQNELAKLGGFFDGVYFCPHRTEDNCHCRKPKPGMLLQIAKDFKVDLSTQALFIGDSLGDIQAGKYAKCPTILVKTGNGNQTLSDQESLGDIPVFANLFEAITLL